MPLERDSMRGVSSRRSACDRCRGQKLRCLRERPDQKRCDRCARAGSECITSPTFRMHIYSDDQARKRRRQQSQGSPPRVVTPYSDQRTPLNIAVENAAMTESYPFSWHSQITASGASEDPQVAAVPSPNVPWEREKSISYDILFHEEMDQEFGSLDGIPKPSGNSGLSQLPLLIPSPTSQPGLPAADSHQATASGPQNVGSSDGDDLEAGGNAGLTIMATSGSVRDDSKPEETPMQRLSQISFGLIALLNRVDKGSPKVSLDTLIMPIDESKSPDPVVDGVLNKTREFLDILKELAGPSQAPSPSDAFVKSAVETGPSNNTSCGQPRSHSSGVSEIDDDTLESPTDSLISSKSSPPPVSETQYNLKTDTASLLLLLTAYIHVLRLYVVLFSHIYDYLKELSDSDDPYLCPVPGLSFSSFPIQSGNLQTIILIQIVTSLFERMETLLGLPREFRLNSRRGEPRRGRPGGLLSHRDFIDIVKLAIKNEEPGRPENGRGGIEALRTRITRTKQLLRDSIAP